MVILWPNKAPTTQFSKEMFSSVFQCRCNIDTKNTFSSANWQKVCIKNRKKIREQLTPQKLKKKCANMGKKKFPQFKTIFLKFWLLKNILQ
jgi:hypothetical protein